MSLLNYFLKKKPSIKNGMSNNFTDTSSKEKQKKFWEKLFNKDKINNAFLDELEEILIKSDFGGKFSLAMVERFKTEIKNQKIKNIETGIELLKKIFREKLLDNQLNFAINKTPVFCLIGINGTGKTTTLAKLAHHYKKDYQIVIAAADTFRAAATAQLKEWANRLQVQFVSKGENVDAAAVAYDAIESSLVKNKGMCLIDTAGRLENKTALMDQLLKLINIINRFKDKVDLKKILVLDITLGRNGFDQAKIFLEKVGLDGIIITKVDTQAKGGFLLSLVEEFKLPIFYLTHGENLEDLAEFNNEQYIESILNHLS